MTATINPRVAYLSSPDTAFRRIYSNTLTPHIAEYVAHLEKNVNMVAVRATIGVDLTDANVAYELSTSSAAIIAAIEAVNNQDYRAAHDHMTKCALYRVIIPDYEGEPGRLRMRAWFLAELVRYIETIYMVETNDEYCGRDHDGERNITSTYVPFTLPKGEQDDFGLYLTFVEFAELKVTPMTAAITSLFGLGCFTLATRGDLSTCELEIANESEDAERIASERMIAKLKSPGPYLDNECIGYDFAFISYMYAEALNYWLGKTTENEFLRHIEYIETTATATKPAMLHLDNLLATFVYHPLKNCFFGRSCSVQQGSVNIELGGGEENKTALDIKHLELTADSLVMVFDTLESSAAETYATLVPITFDDFSEDFNQATEEAAVPLVPVRRGLTRSPFAL